MSINSIIDEDNPEGLPYSKAEAVDRILDAATTSEHEDRLLYIIQAYEVMHKPQHLAPGTNMKNVYKEMCREFQLSYGKPMTPDYRMVKERLHPKNIMDLSIW